MSIKAMNAKRRICAVLACRILSRHSIIVAVIRGLVKRPWTALTNTPLRHFGSQSEH